MGQRSPDGSALGAVVLVLAAFMAGAAVHFLALLLGLVAALPMLAVLAAIHVLGMVSALAVLGVVPMLALMLLTVLMLALAMAGVRVGGCSLRRCRGGNKKRDCAEDSLHDRKLRV